MLKFHLNYYREYILKTDKIEKKERIKIKKKRTNKLEFYNYYLISLRFNTHKKQI